MKKRKRSLEKAETKRRAAKEKSQDNFSGEEEVGRITERTGKRSGSLLDACDEYFPATGDDDSEIETEDSEYDDEDYEEEEKVSPMCVINMEEREKQKRCAKSKSKFEKANLPAIYNDIKFWMPKFLEQPDGSTINIKDISLTNPGQARKVNGLHVNEKISWWHFLSEIVRWCYPKIEHNPIEYASIIIEEVIKPMYHCTSTGQAEDIIRFRRLKNRIVKKLKDEG